MIAITYKRLKCGPTPCQRSILIPELLKQILILIVANKSYYCTAVLVCHEWRNIVWELVEDKIKKISKFESIPI